MGLPKKLQKINEERHALIRKKFGEGLTDAEVERLDMVTESMREHFAPEQMEAIESIKKFMKKVEKGIKPKKRKTKK